MGEGATKFMGATFKIVRFLVIIALVLAAFPWLYEIKTKAGIDILPGVHAGSFLEKYTYGIVKCEWLYPYHCPADQAKAGDLNRS